MSVLPNRTGSVYAGTGISISCTVTVDHGVNNNETVYIRWGGIEQVQHQLITNITRTSDRNYTNYLIISPMAIADSGTFSCTGMVIGQADNQSATHSNDITVKVKGKYLLCGYMDLFRTCISLKIFQHQR